MTFITPVDGQPAIAEHVAQLTEALSGMRAETITLTGPLNVSAAAAFTPAPTVGGSPLLTAAAADALFLTPAEGNTAYAASGHNHSALYEPLDSAYTKSESDLRYATPASVTSAVTTHEGLANPHPNYALDTDLAGYATTGHNHAALYEPLDSAYTKSESDTKYSLGTHNHSTLYEPLGSAYTKSESDAKYVLKTDYDALLARVVALETNMAAHIHAAGDWDYLAGASVPDGTP